MCDKTDTKESSNSNEELEISEKFYQKINKDLQKVGYAEGATDGQNSIFQSSFDKGYEDGFRNGFLLGKLKVLSAQDNLKPERGDCEICVNSKLLEMEEKEVHEKHKQTTGKIQEKLKNHQ